MPNRCTRLEKESKRREAEANVEDSKILTEIEKNSEIERKRIQRAQKGMKKLAALVERRRAFGFEVRRKRRLRDECDDGRDTAPVGRSPVRKL